jgi:hypothetical protein
VSESTTVAETESPATEAPAPDAPPTGSAWAGPDADAPATTTAEAAPPAPPEQPPAPVPAAPAEKPGRRAVAVPMWLLGLLAVAVLVVGAFFVGRETAPKSEGPKTLSDAVEQTAKGDMPVGDFNLQDLIAALQQNGNLNLNLGDILNQLGGNR